MSANTKSDANPVIKMESRSKLDSTHIAQLTIDEEARATRVVMVDTEMSVQMNSQSDSVETHPAKLMASAIECDAADSEKDVIPALDCRNLREVHVSVEGSGGVQVLVSPLDAGDFFYPVGIENCVLKICARRVKVKSINANGNVHLVGRS